MSEFFYMQPLFAYEDGTLFSLGFEVGAITQSPFEAYKRYLLKEEAEKRDLDESWAAELEGYVSPVRRAREGRMFATWTFPERPTRKAAQAHVKVTPPYRVYIVTANYAWGFAPFVLPEGVTINF